MANDGPKKGWRDLGGSKGSSQPNPAGGRGWQQHHAANVPTGRKPWSKKSKLAFAGVLLGVVAALVVIVLQWLKPIKPACLYLVGSGYEESLLIPHNVLGLQGLKDLEALSEKNNLLAKVVPWDQQARLRMLTSQIDEPTAKRTWDALWAEVPKRFDEKTLILFLSLHGGADTKGAYLLANDLAGKTRIPVEKILTDLQHPDLQTRNVILVFDATQIRTSWPLGILHNDFVRKLKELAPRIEQQKNLVVLCASDVDQRSWVSEEWRNSIFGHYLIEGLRGAADKNGDGRITALELHQFAAERVKTWVQKNRDAAQTPILLGGTDRAAAIEVVQVEKTYTERKPEEAPGRTFAQQAELESAWKHWQSLKDAKAYVYAPHLWRQYQDTLIRLEQLIRAGDPTKKTPDLKGKLDRLDQALRRSRRLDLAVGALGNSLPLGQVLGVAPPADVRAIFERLQDAPDREESWVDIFKTVSSREEKQLLQTQLSRLLIEKLVDEKRDSLTRQEIAQASAWLRKVEDRLGQPRSAELHFLVMLDQDALPSLPTKSMQQALRVRLLAERAALGLGADDEAQPYSEAILTWTKTDLDQADDQRRRSEDWLFGATPEHWQKGLDGLAEAEKKYRAVQVEADLVRNALELRDLAWAEMPYLTPWMAGHSTRDARRAKEMAILEETSVFLAKNLDRLTRVLDAPPKIKPSADDLPPDPDHDHPAPVKLSKLTDDVKRDLDRLQVGVRTLCKDHLEGKLSQQRYHEIESVLAGPLVESPRLRVDLLNRSRSITRDLSDGTMPPSSVETGEEPREDVIRRQKNQLLALYGPWLPGRKLLVQDVGERFREWFLGELPDTVQTGLANSLDQTNLAMAATLLGPATQGCRQLPGALADRAMQEPYAPPAGLRQVQTSQLLFWQAKRTVQDHWFEQDGRGEETYYLPAGKAYYLAARRLAEGKPEADNPTLFRQRLQELATFEAKELVPARLIVRTESSPYWTTERSFPVAWQFDAQTGLPSGTPMAWHQFAKSTPAGQELEQRRPLKAWPPESLVVGLDSALKGDRPDDKLPVELQGVYRGQRFKASLGLVQRQPDLIAQRFPPTGKSGVGVRMDPSFTYGAISIILDTSGSMRRVHPIKTPADLKRDAGPGEKSRFDFALAALEQVLYKIPENTFLSFYKFGAQGEQSVPELLRDPAPWRVGQVNPLLDRVRGLRPNEYSPIAKAIVQSMNEGFPRGYSGPKVVLVLTDGYDNHSYDPATTDLEGNTKRVINALTKSADDHPDVELNIVCFLEKEDPELPTATRQFKIVENFDPTPGRFLPESRGERLGPIIEEALRPKLQMIVDGRKVFPYGHLVNHYDAKAIDWKKVPANTYQTQIQKPANDLDLRGGQNLLLALKRGKDRVYLERVRVGAQKEAAHCPREKKDGTLVTLLEHDITPRLKLRDLILFEEDSENGERDVVRSVPPGFIWIELDALSAKSKTTKPLRWYHDVSYPAPAIRAEMDWTLNATKLDYEVPKLDAWWTPREFPRDGDLVTTATLRINAPDRPKKVSVGKTEAIIESIRQEEHLIATGPEATEKKTCLVVRLAYPVGKPVWVRLASEVPGSGVEHQYFRDSGKLTVRFYNLPLNDETIDLQIACVNSLKERGNRAQFTPANRVAPPPEGLYKNPLE